MNIPVDGQTPAGSPGTVYAPVLTPFTQDRLQIDTEAFRNQLAFLGQSGLDGVLLLGTNGEFGQLAEAEKLALVDLATAVAPGLAFIIGITSPDSEAETFRFARLLDERLSQPARFLAAPPFYGRYHQGDRAEPSEVAGFYGRLLDLGLAAPIMAYNVPVPPAGPLTAPVPPETVAAFAAAENFWGIKDSIDEVDNISRYLAHRPGLQLLVGHDKAISAGRAAGAAGSITDCANVFPSAVRAVWNAENEETRIGCQRELDRLRGVLEVIPGKMVAIQKLLLYRIGVVAERSPVREAGLELEAAEVKEVLLRLREVAESLPVNSQLRRLLASAI